MCNQEIVNSFNVLDPKTWQILSGEEILLDLKSLGKKSSATHVISLAIFNKEISPLDLYCYLKGRFGQPNGFQMANKNNHTDNLYHWHYHLRSEKNHLHFLGLTHCIQVIVNFNREITDDEWKALPKNIKKDFSNWAIQKAMVLKKLEKWKLFINPYRRILTIVDKLYIDLDKIKKMEKITYKKMMSERSLSPDKLELMEKTLCLKFLVPVLVESFINLLIFILAKDEIKKNKKLYQDIIKGKIHKRIHSLQINCKGFQKEIDFKNKKIKSIQRIMNSRNDFLHGNVDPTKFSFKRVYFDDRIIPLLKEPGDIMSVDSYLTFIEPEKVKQEVNAAKEFCDFILGHLEPEIQFQVIALFNCDNPGWNLKTNKIGILFPKSIVDATFGDIDKIFIDSEN